MTKEFFNNLLKYHQNLVDPEFLRSILKAINKKNKKRFHIMFVFSFLGTITCTAALLILKPSFNLIESTSNLTTIGMTCISLFIIWLIFEETQISQ